jgi:glycosyltransferase involved in cell wall biosynthesis
VLEAFANASDDRHLVIMGNGPGVSQAKQYARSHANIHYQPAVPIDEVLDYSSSADVGLFLLPPNSCLSYQFSLGNKFFEYLRAGLAVIVSDNPEMAAVVRRHNFGWIYDGREVDFGAFVSKLTKAEVDEKRSRAKKAADLYTWEREELVLKEMYASLFDIDIPSHGQHESAAA